MLRRTTVLGAVIVSAAASLSLLVATSAAADPAPTPEIPISFKAAGTATIANPNSPGLVLKLGPTNLTGSLYSDNSVQGTLPLAPVHVSYKAYGFLPTKATVVFTEVGPVKAPPVSGLPNGNLAVDATARYVATLHNVSFGNTDAQVGTNCQTLNPIKIEVNAGDQGVNLVPGPDGELTGTFDIGKFVNCGKATTLINNLVPGSGNTADIKLSDFSIPQTADTRAAAKRVQTRIAAKG